MTFQEFGRFIQQARKSKGISQQQMAIELGIARATLSGFESGRVADIGFRKVLEMLSYLNYELTPQDVSPLPTFEELRTQFKDD